LNFAFLLLVYLSTRLLVHYNMAMYRILLNIFILADLTSLFAVNLSHRQIHLDFAAQEKLSFFNTISIVLLILTAGLSVLIFLFSPKKTLTNWPLDPPI